MGDGRQEPDYGLSKIQVGSKQRGYKTVRYEDAEFSRDSNSKNSGGGITRIPTVEAEVIDATFEDDAIDLLPVNPMQRAKDAAVRRARRHLARSIENAVDEFFDMLTYGD